MGVKGIDDACCLAAGVALGTDAAIAAVGTLSP